MSSEETARAELRAIREDLEGLQSRLTRLVSGLPAQGVVRPQERIEGDLGAATEQRTVVVRLICEVMLPLITGLTGLIAFRDVAENVSANVTSLPLPSWDEMGTLVQDLEERWNSLRGIAMNVRSTTDDGAR